jgi:hypothetical protein
MLVNEDSRRGNPHKFDISNLRMLQPMSDQRKLNFLETYHIQRNKNRKLMNHDDGQLQSPLIDILIDDQSNQ